MNGRVSGELVRSSPIWVRVVRAFCTQKLSVILQSGKTPTPNPVSRLSGCHLATFPQLETETQKDSRGLVQN